MRLGAVLLALFLIVATAVPANAKTKTDRVIKDDRISESSGLAPSLLHKNVLWTHNDSGHSAQIYGVTKDGSTAATVVVSGEEARDWEAITSLRGPENSPAAGESLIAVGDIGDNDGKHPSVRIVILKEPQNLSDTTVSPVRVLNLTYPGGPRDAEALLADPRSGQLYVISKTLFGAELFAVPKKVWPGNQATGESEVTKMTKVAQLSAALVTDGAFLPDGRMAVRGYGNLAVIAAPATVADGRLETLATKGLPDQEQGESLAVVDDGEYVLVGSEGENSPILRIRLPRVAAEEVEPEPTPSAPETAGETAEQLRDLAGGDTRLQLIVGAGAGVVALAVLIAAAIMLRPSRSRRRRRARR
ncbi:hypothetical protein Kisp01_13330 [Kineosporia sp. NBRC 101677]|uniref:hypothetical protein n=1 Tax=Kineosporia sp. NBRC 101677 TaxID=3032197 RepID=UPI0024A28190|nr:hypothetical protein [Kineosporia sp. NBRC 101677]GLY14317.1 hypothetical protein Kisp01_13330 [Kineosporia sp. NBRC 101677]